MRLAVEAVECLGAGGGREWSIRGEVNGAECRREVSSCVCLTDC